MKCSVHKTPGKTVS